MHLTQRLKFSQVNYRWKTSASISRSRFSQVSHFWKKAWCKDPITFRPRWTTLLTQTHGCSALCPPPAGSALPWAPGSPPQRTGASGTLPPSGSHRVWELFGSPTLASRDGAAENLCCECLAWGWGWKGTALAFSLWCCQPLVTLLTSPVVKPSLVLSPPEDQSGMIQEALLEREVSQGWGRIQ